MDDITGVAKPLEKLTGSVFKAIGALYEPTHIRRKARARKDAELIRLVGEFEKNELVRKAVKRIGHIETRRASS